MCARPFVEVHHIIPQKESGPDTLDNAAPLCAYCHGIFGGNPELRRQLKERRDFWWELCAKNPDAPQAELNKKLSDLWDLLPRKADDKARCDFLGEVRKVILTFHQEAAHKLEAATTPEEIVTAAGIPLSARWGLPQMTACPICGAPAAFVGVNPASPWANVSYRCEKHGVFYTARVEDLDD